MPRRNVRPVLSVVDVADGPGFAISAVTCRGEHAGWSEAESPACYRMVLVRSGRFRRRSRDTTADLDRTVGYLGVPGEEEYFAHPAGGDVCTSVSLRPELWHALARELSRSTVYVDAQLDLAHRRLLRAAEAGDVDFALAERLVWLVAGAVEPACSGGPPSTGAAGDRALVAAARSAIAEVHPAATGLFPLASLLGVSPYRLSRAFPGTLGVSLTRYRNRVRVGHAMDRLEHGENRLADLAADLGFADQAHLTRTVRAHLGHTPTALRRLLRATTR